MDDSYFGGVSKGKPVVERPAKVVTFGLLKCDGKVYTKVLGNARAATLCL